MPDQRFVLTGLSRLTVRVARLLADRGAALTVLASGDEDDLASALPDSAQVHTGDGDTRNACVRSTWRARPGC
ncbi:MAG: hypothetical protein FJW86_02235 [Actinobacteria bacterium]|nr:hypothetical protein [Actinomycetota bacterium]